MGRQIQLYLLPQDIVDFEVALESRDTAMLKRLSPDPRPVFADTAIVETSELTCADSYLVRTSDCDRVLLRAIPSRGIWTIDDLRSPVIQFFGCHFDNRSLKQGRL